MTIDLLHNKIIEDTITERFKASVAESLVPALSSIYGESLQGIQMYEDHLFDNFLLDGVFYYPMTVVLEDSQKIHWISWHIENEKFTDSVPFSYVGEEQLEFDLSPVVPTEFETAIIGRSIYCEEGLIEISVRAASASPLFLAGKYSQTFIDEMARQLTTKICEVMGVSGLRESGIKLGLIFAPATYMEHHSKNVTFRRLLMEDKGSAPRDFWVKWTNHTSSSPFTISDNPVSDEIEFELGEGVAQKIREKEYRHLISLNDEKYRKAMGKKNITEWRDLIKKAVKQGRLTKVVREIPLSEETVLVNEQLASVMGLSMADVSASVPNEEQAVNNDIALELARAAGIDVVFGDTDEPEAEESAEEENAFDFASDEGLVAFDEEDAEEEADEDDDLMLAISLAREAVANRNAQSEEMPEEIHIDAEANEFDFDSIEPSEDEVLFDEELDENEDVIFGDELKEDEVLEENDLEEDELCEEDDGEIILSEDEDENEDLEAPEDEKCEIDISEYDDDEDEKTPEMQTNVVIPEEFETKLREGLEAKIRLEYEMKAREQAEAEALKLRREHEQLLIENRRLEAQAQKELEERKRISEQRKLEEARLRAQIETQVKAEVKERERLAEAARLAVEEQRRLEQERLIAEQQRLEEERRAAEERARAEAEARLRAERELEAERIRQSSVQKEEAPTEKPDRYTYFAKDVKLLFRYSVDPNINARIGEIIKETLKYYGKEKLNIKIRAQVPDQTSVLLEFLAFPREEMELFQNIIKVLGNSGIGIAKAIVEEHKR